MEMWESHVLCEISKALWKPICGFHSDDFPQLLTRSVPQRRGRAMGAAAVPRRREAAGASMRFAQIRGA